MALARKHPKVSQLARNLFPFLVRLSGFELLHHHRGILNPALSPGLLPEREQVSNELCELNDGEQVAHAGLLPGEFRDEIYHGLQRLFGLLTWDEHKKSDQGSEHAHESSEHGWAFGDDPVYQLNHFHGDTMHLSKVYRAAKS